MDKAGEIGSLGGAG